MFKSPKSAENRGGGAGGLCDLKPIFNTDPGTGEVALRTAEISKNHIKFNFDRRKKKSSDLKRSRSIESQKNGEKI